MVFKTGDPSFSLPLYRGSCCAAETMLDSSCRREYPLLPRILPTTIRTEDRVLSEGDLEYLESRDLWFIFGSAVHITLVDVMACPSGLRSH